MRMSIAAQADAHIGLLHGLFIDTTGVNESEAVFSHLSPITAELIISF